MEPGGAGARYGRSALWEHHNRTQVTAATSADLTGFKSSGANFKLALWDPATNGVRYLKTLVHALARQLSPEAFAALRRIPNRDVGDPITVTVAGERVCLDYLQAVLELEFLAPHVPLDGARVLEIGAGYGRTCHTVLSNHDVAAYHIVDLDNSLELARAYLGRVLDTDRFARVRFVRTGEVAEVVEPTRYDLCVNVDSMTEMDPATVTEYLELIDRTCRHFFVKNPVGKYLDPSLDGHAQGLAVVAMALRTGPLRQVLDIDDDRVVAEQAGAFRTAYRPGPDWEVLADGPAVPWSFFRQAVYRRSGPRDPGPGHAGGLPAQPGVTPANRPRPPSTSGT